MSDITLDAEEYADPLTAPDEAPEQPLVPFVESLPTAAPIIQEGPGALLNAIVMLAKDDAVDVTKLQALMGMQERMEERQAEIEFNRALAQLPPMHVKKNGTIDLTSKDDKDKGKQRKPVPFAKWEDMADVIEPILHQHGFRLMFDSVPRQSDGGGLVVTGKLLHRDGHCKTASMPLALDTGPGRNNLQAMGSTLSYGKRYCTEMLLNIVREGIDDDGKSAETSYVNDEQAHDLLVKMEEAGVTGAEKMQAFFARHTNGPAEDVWQVDAADFTRLMNLLAATVQQRKRAAA